jgi:hypothetical protein
MTLPAFSLTWLPLLLLHSSRQEQTMGNTLFHIAAAKQFNQILIHTHLAIESHKLHEISLLLAGQHHPA